MNPKPLVYKTFLTIYFYPSWWEDSKGKFYDENHYVNLVLHFSRNDF